MPKPVVRVTAPTAAFAGEQCVVEIEITAKRARRVDFVDATLVGEQGWSLGGKAPHINVTHLELVARVMSEGMLLAETPTRLWARFALPRGLPPTHEIEPAYSRLWLRVHVSIPWRLDIRQRYALKVRVAPPPLVERTPVVMRSTALTVAADKPRIELALASARLTPGEPLAGTCAVLHVDDRAPIEVKLMLVPTLTLRGRGRERVVLGQSFGWTLNLPAGGASTGIRFTLPLPATLTPDCDASTHSVRWRLVASSGSLLRGRLELGIPLEVLDPLASATMAQPRAAPRLGDERIAAVFAAFAARHGWRAADVDDPTVIEREIGDCTMRLAYSYRGPEGTFLATRIDHPSLGLGLSITPGSAFMHVFFEDIEIDLAAWDRAHSVVARSAAQAVPFLRAVAPTQLGSKQLGSLVHWTDHGVAFEHAVAAVDDAQLLAMARELEQLALVISTGRGAIAPPAGIATELDAWHALAHSLDARLTIGDLSIDDGMLDGARVHLGLTWDDPHGTHRTGAVEVSVGDTHAASPALAAIVIGLVHPARDVLGSQAAEPLVEQLTRWPDDVVELRVVEGVATAVYAPLPAPPGQPTVVDAARVRELVFALRAVLAALEPSAGPYR